MSIMSIILVFLAFNFLIFFHELGHFITAKLTGMEVTEFAVGFGKKIFSYKYKDTLYSFRLIPLGGFNEIKSLDSGINKETKYSFKTFKKRFLVLFAGSGFNFLLAFLTIFAIINFNGVSDGATNRIETIQENSVASSYLQPGDELLTYNGLNVENGLSDDIRAEIKKSSTSDITLLRNNELFAYHFNKTENEPLGIINEAKINKVGFLESIPLSINKFLQYNVLIVKATEMLFTVDNLQVTDAVAGPIGISTLMYSATESQGIIGLLAIFILININLAMFNLLPIPLLDGGHIFIEFLNFVTNNKIKEKQIKYINYVGYSFMGFLFILGFYSDIHRIVTGFKFLN